ncbi:MAG: hypothetical protein Q9216_004934 [Gyalolechia sp. 2 TL-2023]
MGLECLVTSRFISQASAAAADPATIPAGVTIGAAPGTASSAATAIVMVVHVYAPPLRANRYRQALNDRSSGVTGRVHSIID